MTKFKNGLKLMLAIYLLGSAIQQRRFMKSIIADRQVFVARQNGIYVQEAKRTMELMRGHRG